MNNKLNDVNQNTLRWISNTTQFFFLTELKQGDRWNIFVDMHVYIKQKLNIYIYVIGCQSKERKNQE